MAKETTIPNSRQIIGGKDYIGDGRGGFTPVELVKPQDMLQHELVLKIATFAAELSDQVARFKEHTFDDIGDFEALLAQEYDAKIGGRKGNKTLMTADSLVKVQVAVADQVAFGPELQTAKSLVDECLNEWSADSRPEIRAIVTRAFNTDKEGQINRAEIFTLLRLEIEDERWQRAMKAIRDAMRVVGSKTYIRCYRRDRHDAAWEAITIDLAKA